jgi:hypothetical protein
VRLDGFTEAPRQASRADCHGVAATVGFALELQEREQCGGSVRHNNGTSPELGLLILTMHRASCQLTYLFSTSLRMLPCKLAVTVASCNTAARGRRRFDCTDAIVTLRMAGFNTAFLLQLVISCGKAASWSVTASSVAQQQHRFRLREQKLPPQIRTEIRCPLSVKLHS